MRMVCLDRQEEILNALETMLVDNKEFHAKILGDIADLKRTIRELRLPKSAPQT
jgi:hypothetical protein